MNSAALDELIDDAIDNKMTAIMRFVALCARTLMRQK